MAKKQESLFDHAKTWWETDNAKAIATIVAVLLIPAAVVAWNYASNREVVIDEDNEIVVEENENENGNEMNAEVLDENTETESTEGQEPTAMSDEENLAVGGLENVSTLPDTASDVYVVQKEDSIYSISQKVCGNDSFYLNNRYKDYLKVGSELEIVCE